VRRAVRILGTLLVAGGLCLLLWSGIVWRWQDPFTALYTTYQQHRLAAGLDQRLVAYTPPRELKTSRSLRRNAASIAREQRLVAREARHYRKQLRTGDPLGRLHVPRLHLSIVVVTGTDHDSLTKGPGWYMGSFLPGEGQLIYIAGHRTTYLAPFAAIQSLRPGDTATLDLPYGTFVYRVTGHAVVPADDIGQLRSHGREVLALQACHPRFFATHRYIVYARPVRALPHGGQPYSLKRPLTAAAT
jgi:sortase A